MKTVLITGAAGNLGSAVVQKFLTEGYRVIAAVANAEQIASLGTAANLDAQALDLSDESAAAAFVAQTISKYQRLDACMMLVGGFAAGSIDTASGDEIRKQFTLNFETAYFIARPLFKHMMEAESGRLIFVGARPSIDPAAGKDFLAYALSKSLLFKLAELLNAQARGKNVTASVIVPSTIDTPFNRKNNPEVNPDNWVKADEIAAAMEFIVSERGRALREPVFKMYSNS
jgi:NAD(P)-dependent dehydrogenase (short-subunit alcohol dehydrogenase family)